MVRDSFVWLPMYCPDHWIPVFKHQDPVARKNPSYRIDWHYHLLCDLWLSAWRCQWIPRKRAWWKPWILHFIMAYICAGNNRNSVSADCFTIGIHIFLIWSLLAGNNLCGAISLFLIKLLVDYIFVIHGIKKFQREKLIKFFPIWIFFYFFYHIVCGPLSITKKIKWK